mmetsp:Transcript_28261/g.65453  ORF Transcript_28261/g.65453 Transcript_28261/m.65453 type:complete len:782 (-) Transcript_28261:1163-3508(-)
MKSLSNFRYCKYVTYFCVLYLYSCKPQTKLAMDNIEVVQLNEVASKPKIHNQELLGESTSTKREASSVTISSSADLHSNSVGGTLPVDYAAPKLGMKFTMPHTVANNKRKIRYSKRRYATLLTTGALLHMCPVSFFTPVIAEPQPTSCPEDTQGTCENDGVVFSCNFDPKLPIEKACPLILEKMKDPTMQLSATQSLDLCRTCIDYGHRNAQKVRGRDIVMFLGNTGAGKSTLINYLMGCEMALERPDNPILDPRVIVKPHSHGGNCSKNFTKIGHDIMTSETFMPKVILNTENDGQFYVDCPGFLDSRGEEISLANTVNNRAIMQNAASMKVVALVDFSSLKTARATGFKEFTKLLKHIFGDNATLHKYKESILLGITKIPPDFLNANLANFKYFLAQVNNEVLRSLESQIFLYDPLDRGSEDFLSREELREKIEKMSKIPSPGGIVQTAFSAREELYLTDLAENTKQVLHRDFSRGEYESASNSWKYLENLNAIKHPKIDNIISGAWEYIEESTSNVEKKYNVANNNYDIPRARGLRKQFVEILKYFPKVRTRPIIPNINHIPNGTFGPMEWKTYFGNIELSSVPKLPDNIEQILDSECPYNYGSKIRNTHILTLIPEKIGNIPLTIDLLCAESPHIRSQAKCNMAKFVRDYLEHRNAGSTRWILMLKKPVNLLFESFNDQLVATESKSLKVMVDEKYSTHYYRIPNTLEVVSSLLTNYINKASKYVGDYGGHTSDLIPGRLRNYHTSVGEFGRGGLSIDYTLWDILHTQSGAWAAIYL